MSLIRLVRGLCFAGLCIGWTLTFGVTGSASATQLLFVPHSGHFPYHLAGRGGNGIVETVGGKKVTSTELDVLALVLSPSLFNASLTFLGVKNEFGEECQNEGAGTATVTLKNLLGHLGIADHEGKERLAALVLLGKVHFFCNAPIIGKVLVLVQGSVIGEAVSPALNVATEELSVRLTQRKGKQLLQSILFGNTLVTGQHPEMAIDGTSGFEEYAKEGEATLKALKGEGTFLLISP